jgi:hypothetical protein
VSILAQQRRRLREPRRELLLRRIAGERRHAGNRLVQHAGQRVDVASPVERAVAGLLGAHVRRRAGDRALLGDLLARAVDRARDAEVGHHRVTAGEENVLRLDVAVHDPSLVRVGQRAGDLAPDAHRFFDREPVVRRQPLPQRLTLDEGHDVVQLVRHLAGIVDRQDVRMLQAGRELDLAQEALRADRVRQLRMEHLDGDEPLVPLVAREVHRGRATATDLPLQRVPPTTDIPLHDELAGEDVVQGRRSIVHGWLRLGGER